VVLQFLIGYKQNLIVLWDIEEDSVLQTYAATQVIISMIYDVIRSAYCSVSDAFAASSHWAIAYL